MTLTKLKLARLKRGMLQWQVAAEIGISESSLSKLESGRRRPTRELLARIAAVLEVPLDQIEEHEAH